MQIKENNHTLTIQLDKRVDSNNAPEIEKEIFPAIEGIADQYETIEIDAHDLVYISSAGLRVLMKIKKKTAKEVSVLHASKDVYDIFEMTGFTEILNIKKDIREVSVEGCKVIGTGGYGTVYRLDDDTIIKVYHENVSLEFIDKERAVSKKAFVLGIPTAIPFDIVKVGNQFGVIYEMLEAKTIAQLITEEPSGLPELAALSANALKNFHKIKPALGDFPNNKTKFKNWLNYIAPKITTDEYQKISDFVDSIPDADTFLHGDYNSKNVMIKDGEILLIDIGDATIGHPVFDLAGLMLAYIILPRSPRGPEQIKQLLGFDVALAPQMWNVMCGTYFGTNDPERIKAISKMITPVMYLDLCFHGSYGKKLSPEQFDIHIKHSVRGMLLKSLENYTPIDF